jgi:hypothetical protein
MKLKLPRRRWLLFIACLAAAIAAISGWHFYQWRFTRAQYDRIRLGMTQAEVSQIMEPAGIDQDNDDSWETVAEEHRPTGPVRTRYDMDGIPLPDGLMGTAGEGVGAWQHGSLMIWVYYHDGKAFRKDMCSRVPQSRYWFAWLRWHAWSRWQVPP